MVLPVILVTAVVEAVIAVMAAAMATVNKLALPNDFKLKVARRMTA